MDANTIQTMIGTLGFPIVMVIALAYFIWHIWKKSTEQNETREEKLYRIIGESQAVNKELTATNAEFVSVLNAYKTDLETIRDDVNEIKTNMKG